jgi:glutamyl-tRNA synthetase
MKKTRLRFAPSPTGPLHIGGVRTALFNYLFAKKHNGDFILRIEDTDQTRYVKGAEEYILEALDWCGIKFDEDIIKGGKYAPYRQSERKEIYKKYADKLLKSGNAYLAFDTTEDLDKIRKQFESKKETFAYNANTRKNLKNSLSLSKAEINNLISNNCPYVVRFKMPENQSLEITDLIRGKIIVNTSTLDDKVLFKADGMPTYHLANVVDDYLMKITHVIRGEEWLPSLPLHVLLYKSLGWENEMPQFAHLPLILKPTGNGKLSKRDGDKMGFPVFPILWNSQSGEQARGFREDGYFPEAFINMLCLLGWNPGNNKEIFSMEELIKEFSLERIVKTGARFNPDKAKWFNHKYLVDKTDKELSKLLKNILEKNNLTDFSDDYLIKVCSLLKERANFVLDIFEEGKFFFIKPDNYDEKIIKKKWKENSADLLLKIATMFDEINDFSKENVENNFKKYLEKNEISFGQIMNILRLALVGTTKGPDLFEIITLLGKKETIERIKKAVKNINK